MMLFTKTLPLIVAFTTALDSPIPGHEIVDLAWDVEVSPGGPHITLNGTIQQVYHELTQLNPEFKLDLSFLDEDSEDDDDITLSEEELSSPSSPLLKRQSIRDYFCFGRWRSCSRRRIEEGVRYLRGVPGTPSMSPGPGSCGRVSCSHDAAIFICNDNTGFLNLNSWNVVADGADYIRSRCISGDQTAGQVFFHENWNVIVRWDDC
ncbi:hypothetical protein BJX64DRAFT_291147 [Aspergillus heterothallicus]